MPTGEQGALFEVEDMPSAEYSARVSASWERAKRQVLQWHEQGLDLVMDDH